MFWLYSPVDVLMSSPLTVRSNWKLQKLIFLYHLKFGSLAIWFGWGSDGQPRVAKYREPHDFLLAIIVTWRYQEKPPKNNYEDVEI